MSGRTFSFYEMKLFLFAIIHGTYQHLIVCFNGMGANFRGKGGEFQGQMDILTACDLLFFPDGTFLSIKSINSSLRSSTGRISTQLSGVIGDI